ncbi:MAG TPA: nuclear transport factor 2 family protein [Terriglobales bacterium]|nr:nuclear transport factor 2 family protein [Terriglobales bacterium]
MRSTKVIVLVCLLLVVGAFIAYRGVKAQMQPAAKSDGLQRTNTSEQLQSMLRDFLIGAGKNDPAAHDRFWADDLVYTGASGKVKTKAEIMQSVREEAAKPADPNASKATFDAEDVLVHDYGDFAVVNFRLVAHIDDHGKQETGYYRNTGTFAKRNGQWKVIAWQATKIESPTQPAK